MSHQWVIKSLKEAKRTKKPQHFLDFIQVASINFCDYLLQGDGTHVMPDRDRGDFFTLCDPITRHRARNFDVCEQCRNKLLALLPDLGDIFVPAPRLLPGEYLECDLRDDGPRWEAYIATFSRAVKIKKERSETEMLEILVPWLDCPPDRVCPGTEPQKQAAWHFVPSLEDFTICPDCYWKEIQSRMYRDHLLQRVEDRPQIVPDETVCHMSVKKLKHLFLDAAEANDMRTLIGEFKNRLALEREYRRAARKHEEYKADKYKYSLKRNTLRNQRAHASLIANQEKLSARAEDDAEHYRRKLRRLKKEWEARWDDPLRAGLQEPLDDDEDAD